MKKNPQFIGTFPLPRKSAVLLTTAFISSSLAAAAFADPEEFKVTSNTWNASASSPAPIYESLDGDLSQPKVSARCYWQQQHRQLRPAVPRPLRSSPQKTVRLWSGEYLFPGRHGHRNRSLGWGSYECHPSDNLATTQKAG